MNGFESASVDENILLFAEFILDSIEKMNQ